MRIHSFMSDLANLRSYKGCAATLGTLLSFKLTISIAKHLLPDYLLHWSVRYRLSFVARE